GSATCRRSPGTTRPSTTPQPSLTRAPPSAGRASTWTSGGAGCGAGRRPSAPPSGAGRPSRPSPAPRTGPGGATSGAWRSVSPGGSGRPHEHRGRLHRRQHRPLPGPRHRGRRVGGAGRSPRPRRRLRPDVVARGARRAVARPQPRTVRRRVQPRAVRAAPRPAGHLRPAGGARVTRYAGGADFEREVRAALVADGYELVVRSAGSKTKVDLVAIKAGQVLIVQCKRNGVCPP